MKFLDKPRRINMRKILSFSLSIILALSLAGGSITASAHVNGNNKYPGYGQTMESEQRQGKKPGEKKHDSGFGQGPVATTKPMSTVTPTMEPVATEVATVAPVETEVPVATEDPVATEVATEEPITTEVPVVTEEPITTEAPVVTEDPVVTEASTEVPTVTEVPAASEVPEEEQDVTAAPVMTEEPTVAPEMTAEPETPAVNIVDAIFYVLKMEYTQPSEVASYPIAHYSKVGAGKVIAEIVANDNEAVEEHLVSIPAYKLVYGDDWYIQWYVVKVERDGWHVDGIWTKVDSKKEEPVATEEPEVTEEPKVTETPEVTEEPEVTGTPIATETPAATAPVATEKVTDDSEEVVATATPVITASPEATKSVFVNVNNVPEKVIATQTPSSTSVVTVTATPVVTPATEAPNTDSQPVINDEKEVIQTAAPDVTVPSSKPVTVPAVDTITIVATEAPVVKEVSETTTGTAVIVEEPAIPSEPVVGVLPAKNEITILTAEAPHNAVVTLDENVIASNPVINQPVTTVLENAEVVPVQKPATKIKNAKVADYVEDTTTVIEEDEISSTPVEKASLPQTGATSEMVFYIYGGLLCALGICTFIVLRKKEVNQ